MLESGKHIFRFDTFGDEAFWGDTLRPHQAIAGEKLGGVGRPGVSPKTALSVGLKVDVDALPPSLVNQLKAGKVNLDDPATTLGAPQTELSCGCHRLLRCQGQSEVHGNTVRVLPLKRGRFTGTRHRPQAGWLGQPRP